MSSISRRGLLAASAGSLTAFAGCSAFGDSSEEEPEPFAVGDVQLSNYAGEPREVDVLIRRDDEVVH